MRYFTLSLSILLLAGLPACKRIESKLDRLARAAGITPELPPEQKTALVEAPLTPEQEAMEKRLQESAVFEAAKEEDLQAPKAEAFELNKSAVVSILGYHDFRERGGSPMIIAASKFKEQMKAIKESGIPVIPLSDVIAWRKGLKNIPEESLVITMDDGWAGVYTYAYPILKEYDFPFTVYVYKKYVNIGGRSLSWAQIKEMTQHGCEIGSHSVSHESLRAKKGRTDAEHLQWVLGELKDSKEFIEKNLGVPCTTFAYPFGVFDEVMAETGLQVGYESLVTVNSQKVNWDTHLGKIGRFIIHGESDANFRLATSFRGRGDVTSNHFLKTDAKDADGKKLVEMSPGPDEVIKDRRPVIRVNLQRVGSVVPGTVRLRIAGLGTVPAQYDPVTMMVVYPLPYRLRRQDCAVTLSFKRAEGQPDEVVTWRFKVDLEASYLPQS
ncbi:polysaccharide deacetylase [Prosthecobacter fusiformis]|uniref:Polysaccharide deacetylase n=1 Tax=Prosthecobacter fusiformis TaxID=48464 RepID=A0A4R7RW59_9BACT|nr:polysaccharide deacetylase family protein [Prosthecobacter fusiformis]TDU69238.1 polysaccharide deacetylase [Prosthecobacter fusiformis]